MSNCGNCKYWDEDGYYLGCGICGRVKMFWESTEWSREGDKRVFRDSAKDELAFAQDGSDFSAFLVTKPEFYCNQWEAK